MSKSTIESVVFHAYRFLAETVLTDEKEEVYDDDDGHIELYDDEYEKNGDAAGHGGEELLDAHGGHGDGHSEFGVHITYQDLYRSVIFLGAIYVSGQIASSKYLKMPNLVGEIICGIILGPPLLDIVPNARAWVLLGELGLILLVLEAGIDIDLSTLKLIGTRGFMIAFLGSILPIGIGMFIAYILNVDGGNTKAIIASGATFGPTSLGIALNILRSGGILNTPVGQLIVSAAVIDDMIALVILSQLDALTGEIDIVSVVIPIISALLFLVLGGYIAIFVLPSFIEKHVLERVEKRYHDKVEFAIMIVLLVVLMPATYYAEASYLMGAFIAGLTFCSSHGLHHLFVRQFKRLLQWLMRIFFSASIGFQVPIKDFADITVLWQGLVFALALMGKLAVGFLVPNFTQSMKFTNTHLRDCLITGFSMAAEGEFAFVIAVFAVDGGLIGKDLYASVVLAVLISTIIPPFLLRFTISYYNKKAEQTVEKAINEEAVRKHDLEDGLESTDGTHKSQEDELRLGIKNKTTVFLCIQTQCDSKWGLLHSIMNCMSKKKLEIIDHRAWAPRGINTTLVNEVYAKSSFQIKGKGQSQEALDDHIKDIEDSLKALINQPDARVKVQRWYPGVVEEIVEQVNEKSQTVNISQRLLNEASHKLETKQMLQQNATQSKTVAEILGESNAAPPVDVTNGAGAGAGPDVAAGAAPAAGEGAPPQTGLPTEFTAQGGLENPPPVTQKARRRVRNKTRSTPVVGGGLFGETIEAKSGRESKTSGTRRSTTTEDLISKWGLKGSSTGVPAEIHVSGETYTIRISHDTWKDLQKGARGAMVDSRGIEISAMNIAASEDTPVGSRLTGYVRMAPLNQIKEETLDEMSEMSSSHHGDTHEDQKGV